MPKKGRTRIAATEVATREQAEMILAEHARLSAELQQAEARLAAALVQVNDQYEGAIEKLKEQIEHRAKLLNTWAEANPQAFPKQRKSIDFIFGRIGYRTTTPKVSQLNKQKAEAIIAKLKTAALALWIRSKEEIDKERIIADWQAAKTDEAQREQLDQTLAAVDLRVTQSETFFVEPKLELAANLPAPKPAEA